MSSTRNPGRVAGALYLLLSIPAVFALIYVPNKLIVSGNATATALNIAASESLFRIAIVTELISQALFIFVALALYDLLKGVNQRHAMMMVVLILVSIPIAFLNELNAVSALVLVRGADFLSVFEKPQRDALAMLFLNLHSRGFDIAGVFWGLWLFPLGLLVYRSRFIPRFLGVWLILNGITYVVMSLTAILWPQYRNQVFTYGQPAFFGEVAFMLWILIKGARPPIQVIRAAAVGVAFLAATQSASAQQRTARPPSAAGVSITPQEFAARRDALAARVENGVIVAFGGRALVHDFGSFFQLPSFHYLTNYDEPDGAFVMVVRAKRFVGTLFITRLNARTAFYYGQRTDTATSRARFGLPARSFAALPAVLDSLVATGLPFYTLSDVEDLDFAGADTLTRGQRFMSTFAAAHHGVVVRDAMPIVLQLRAKKSTAELALLRRAAEISSEGHRAAMLTADPTHEYDLRASLEYTFTRLGAERLAYGSIVGAGINGTQLHYMKDTDPVQPSDVVVMDAAAEYHGYAADITRTIPASGRYSPEQRQLYQLVRDAQDVAERNSKPGMRASVAADSSVVVRARGLAALGLIESVNATFDPPWPVDCARQPASCRQSNLWMIHGISHGLGLAVHDPVQASFGDLTYQIGDAFTIEPGIYISTRSLDVLPDTPKNRAFIAAVRVTVLKYQNIGVRIEDDYIITDKGLERISMVPREIPEIEALMQQRQRVVP